MTRILIEIDGIGAIGADKIRVMPDGHWDWSIPVPLSQGWKVDDLVFVGGQVSADARGGTVAPADIVAQTRNTYGFIQKVLEKAGAGFSDIVQLNVFYTGGEAISEFGIHLPDFNTVLIADEFFYGLPNLHSIRGPC